MRTFLAAFLTLLMLLPVSAFGEIQTITHTVKQTFGGSQSPDDARISAMAKAKREALEMAGTYIESLTVVQNFKVEKDEILALTAGVLKAEVVSQNNYHTDDAFGIEIVVKIVVDTSVLEERVKKLLQDKTHLTQLKDIQKREKKLLQRVAQLETENRKLSANNQSNQKLKKEFQKVTKGLTAVDWFNKALSLLGGAKYTDSKKAIGYLNNAILLQPDFAFAYSNRGTIFDYLGQYQRAMKDYNQAIRLKPDFAGFYFNRGGAHNHLGQHQLAIKDYDEAIRLEPDNADAYYNRGSVFGKIGQYQPAIEDYNEAIQLQPDNGKIYNNRGHMYYKLGQHQLAIQDYTEAIRLKPNGALIYYNRATAFGEIGQHQPAIEDYTEAIRIKPDYEEAYSDRGATNQVLGHYQLAIKDYSQSISLKPNDSVTYHNRGRVYLISGDKKLGCRDAQKACSLGNCKLLEIAKGKGYCR